MKYTRAQKRVLGRLRDHATGVRATPYWPRGANGIRTLEALERKGAIAVDWEAESITVLDDDWRGAR